MRRVGQDERYYLDCLVVDDAGTRVDKTAVFDSKDEFLAAVEDLLPLLELASELDEFKGTGQAHALA